MRIGIGYDIHRLEPGLPLILAGVHIPFEMGLKAHSDGDAVAHAVTDALLGAAALGDIGSHFPDTDPKYKGADSMALLRKVVEEIGAAGFAVVNVDANVVAERPKLATYIDSMRNNLAEALRVDASYVSIKARTNEQVGAEGRGEAISVQAAVLLRDAG